MPLTYNEIQQVMEPITALRTPLKLNGFINGKTVVAITRDTPADTRHFGQEVSLKAYERHEIGRAKPAAADLRHAGAIQNINMHNGHAHWSLLYGKSKNFTRSNNKGRLPKGIPRLSRRHRQIGIDYPCEALDTPSIDPTTSAIPISFTCSLDA